MLLRDTDANPITPGESSRRLVVLIHGWAMRPIASMDDVEAAICEALPDADLLSPKFSKRFTSLPRPLADFAEVVADFATNADPIAISEAIADAIEAALESRRSSGGDYGEIILVGFSLGALLIRKAYVFGRGLNQDGLIPLPGRRREWTRKVSRILLLAGTSRGWTITPKPKHMPLAHFAVTWLVLKLRWLPPLRWIGGLILSIERGAPFIANLRLQWLELIASEEPLPPTIQLLGDRDDLVNQEDNIDIQLASSFLFKRLPQTGHASAIDFCTSGIGPQRKRLFQDALTKEITELEPDFLPVEPLDADREVAMNTAEGCDDDEVTDVILVLHGIRDYGDWPTVARGQLDIVLEDHQRRSAENSGGREDQIGLGRVIAVAAKYPRFSLYDFLFRRHARVRWFVDRYTEIRARYPRSRCHFIGHSNGTYLMAQALLEYATVRFDRIALAGSVLPREFPWDQIVRSGRATAVRNDRASGDWVVAIFPRSWELLCGLLPIGTPTIGGAGVLGFIQVEGSRHEVFYLRGDHGAAVCKVNHPSLFRFVLGLDPEPVLDPTLLPLVEDLTPSVKFHATWSGLYPLLATALLIAGMFVAFSSLPAMTAWTIIGIIATLTIVVLWFL